MFFVFVQRLSFLLGVALCGSTLVSAYSGNATCLELDRSNIQVCGKSYSNKDYLAIFPQKLMDDEQGPNFNFCNRTWKATYETESGPKSVVVQGVTYINAVNVSLTPLVFAAFGRWGQPTLPEIKLELFNGTVGTIEGRDNDPYRSPPIMPGNAGKPKEGKSGEAHIPEKDNDNGDSDVKVKRSIYRRGGSSAPDTLPAYPRRGDGDGSGHKFAVRKAKVKPRGLSGSEPKPRLERRRVPRPPIVTRRGEGSSTV